MADVYSKEKRSQVMSAVRSTRTKPEITLGKILHGMGLRYRLNVRKLPGSPDFAFARHRKVVFIHGCFWHQHEGCVRATVPATRRVWWAEKLTKNTERDRQVLEELRGMGWQALVVWQCELRDVEKLQFKIREFFAHEKH